MELNHQEKENLLSPIINEVGILSPESKHKLIEQIYSLINRIIIKNYEFKFKEENEEIAIVKEKINIIENNVNMMHGLCRQILKIVKPTPEIKKVISESKVEVKKKEIKELSTKSNVLNTFTFSKLNQLAIENNIKLTSRMNKQDIIKKLLDKEI
jgi:hypothetical protein